VVQCLPDDGNGGLQAYIERDKQYPDIPHEPESEATLEELTEEFGEEFKDEVLDEVRWCRSGRGCEGEREREMYIHALARESLVRSMVTLSLWPLW